MMIVNILKQACQQVHPKTKGLAGTTFANRQMGRGAGGDMSGVRPTIVERLAPIIVQAYHIRQFGANALEMCFLARGFLDAYIDLRGKIRPTDIAAGYLIAKEAGAKIYSD